jgi:hypothetical protein
MKPSFLLFLFFALLIFQSCNDDDINLNDLGAAVEGNFKGVLKMDGDVIDENFQIEIIKLSDTSIILNSSECNAIEVRLEGNATLGILGVLSPTDTLDSFSYAVEDERLKFLVNNSSVFKTFEGNKE